MTALRFGFCALGLALLMSAISWETGAPGLALATWV